MQVILMQDVAKLGRRYTVVNVPDGYGLNKLIPQGLAKPATSENLKAVKNQAAKAEAKTAASTAKFVDLVKILSGKVIDVKVEANEDGKLYQALKGEDIAEAAQSEVEMAVPASQIVIKAPIKTLGEHTIDLANGDTVSSFTINVIAK